MNAHAKRQAWYALAAGACALVLAAALFSFRTRRNVAVTTYHHLEGGITWRRTDYFESYYRPFSLTGLAAEIKQAVPARALPRWRSRVEVHYQLLEPLSGDRPEVLARMNAFLRENFTAGNPPLPAATEATVNQLIADTREQLANRRRQHRDQREYLDFRTMKVLHESPRHIVLQVSLEKEPGGIAPHRGGSAVVLEKGTGRMAPFPETWNPLVDPPIEALFEWLPGTGTGPGPAR